MPQFWEHLPTIPCPPSLPFQAFSGLCSYDRSKAEGLIGQRTLTMTLAFMLSSSCGVVTFSASVVQCILMTVLFLLQDPDAEEFVVIADGAVSPDIAEGAVSPVITDGAVSPDIADGAFSPDIADAAFSPDIADAAVVPDDTDAIAAMIEEDPLAVESAEQDDDNDD